MKEKKHIDELFKDRFKNFEASPSPQVWDQIQAKLKEEKQDRKVIPIWWKVAGVAALIALLFTIGNTFFNTSDSNNTITNEETTSPLLEEAPKEKIIEQVDTSEVASENEKSEAIKNETQKSSNDNSHIKKQTPKETIIKNKSAHDAVAVQNSTIKSSEKNQKEAVTNSYINKNIPIISSEKEAIAKTDIQKQDIENSNTQDVIDSEKKVDDLIKKEANISETTKVGVATSNTNEVEKVDSEKIIETTTEDPIKKQSIFDAIEEQKAIETEVAQTKSDPPSDRWEVAPKVGPVYYNSIGEGSSIDPSFADNPQSGDVNFSYGINVSYALNDRLSIRSGVSNIDLSYSTTGIELGTGPVSSALQSINYGGRETVLTAADKGTFSSSNPDGGFGNITPKSTNGEAMLIQNIKYYEVPLELKYALLSTRIGMHVVGGASTLFLGDNEVSVEAGDFRSTLGEANNLSSVSFSANLGLGFDYKISKKLMFNIEPMFKYQLNPYTDSSVDFKPYNLGVYSGLSFKF